MQGPGPRKTNVGPSWDWLREQRERAERGGAPPPRPRARSRSRSRSYDRGNGGKGRGRADEDVSRDWQCPSCGTRNFARRTECFKCGERRPSSRSRSRSRSYEGGGRDGVARRGGGKGGKSGRGEEDTSQDWHCEECGARNFARRTECFKCGASRSGGHSRSRSRSRSRDPPPSRGKDSGGKGGKQGRSEGSRDLVQQQRRRSRSPSGGSSSSSRGPKKVRARFGAGLWDSTQKVPEAKPAGPPAKKKQHGLVVDVGSKVNIHRLKGAPQYNGCEGKVTNGPNEKARWLVQLIFDGGMKELALLAENLEPKPSCGWELVAGGLSMSTTEQDVTRVFSQFGHVQRVTVTRDLNGISKGVALIVMSHKDSAEKALSAGLEIDICGIPAKVQWSTMVKQEMGLLKTRDEENDDAAFSSRRKFQEEGVAAGSLEQTKVAARPSGICVGSQVTVQGLKSAPQFNGKQGQIQSFRSDGRAEVLLHCGETRTLALKVENLVPEGEEAPAAAEKAGPEAREDEGEEERPASTRRRFRDAPAEAA